MIRRVLCTVLAFIALAALMPAAAHAQEAYPPDGAVGLVIDEPTCANNNLHGFVHGAVPGSTVHVVVTFSGSTIPVDVVADAAGRADFTLQIPVPRPAGVTVTATGTTPNGAATTAPFSLTSTVSFATCTTLLVQTGSNVAPWVRAGAGSVGVGALIVVATRRRRRTPGRQTVAS